MVLSLPLLLATLLLVLVPALAFAQSITDPDTDPRVREIAKDLQCPVCQNLSVADSPSGLAHDMRGVIAQQLDQGRSREQIEGYFVERYGEGILLRPSAGGFTGLVWLGPWIVLALGLVLIAATLRGRLRPRSSLQRAGTSPAPTNVSIDPRGSSPLPAGEGQGEGTPSPSGTPTDRYERQLDAELARYREQVG
jgi:cytochrome c-type biogenesis protein CcmH